MRLGVGGLAIGRIDSARGCRALLVILVVTAMLLPVPLLAGPVEMSEASSLETSLEIGLTEAIDSLNPFIGVSCSSYIFYGLVYDYLVSIDEDLNPTPNLALSWFVVPDQLPFGSVWQYNLTRNATWHDGEPFTADDVVFTFDYQTGINWTTMWAYQPYTVLVDFAEKVDESTVRLHYMDFQGDPAPASYGESMMVPIVPEHIWGSISPAEAGFSYTNPFPIGTGPFKCTDQTYDEFLAGNLMILPRNPGYHGVADYGREVQFDRLILLFYSEPSALLTDIQNGAIDLADLPAIHYGFLTDWLLAHPTPQIGTHSGLSCTQYSKEIGVCMNDQSGPDTNLLRLDPAVRQAMAHATNKSFIADVIYDGYAAEGYSLISPIAPFWYWEPSPSDEYGFSIDLANQVLDDAGYVWSGNHTVRFSPIGYTFEWQGVDYTISNEPLEFEMVIEAGNYEDMQVFQFLEDEWAQCGIKLTARIVDTALWGVIVYGGYYDLMITYWNSDPDPASILFTQSTYALAGWSENWYSSQAYDENYTTFVTEMDPLQRRQSCWNCLYWDYRDAPYIVFCYPYDCYAWRTDSFSGWGDWSAHPGRSFAHYWSANQLFFDLVPVPPANSPPTAVVDYDPVLGDIYTDYAFSANDSWDLEDPPDVLEVRWDWESDGAFDTDWTTDKYASHQFSTSGFYNVTLEVRDSQGLTDNETVQLQVVDLIPEFPVVLLPSIVGALLVIVFRSRRRRR